MKQYHILLDKNLSYVGNSKKEALRLYYRYVVQNRKVKLYENYHLLNVVVI